MLKSETIRKKIGRYALSRGEIVNVDIMSMFQDIITKKISGIQDEFDIDTVEKLKAVLEGETSFKWEIKVWNHDFMGKFFNIVTYIGEKEKWVENQKEDRTAIPFVELYNILNIYDIEKNRKLFLSYELVKELYEDFEVREDEEMYNIVASTWRVWIDLLKRYQNKIEAEYEKCKITYPNFIVYKNEIINNDLREKQHKEYVDVICKEFEKSDASKQASKLLDKEKLLLLTGAAGIGKTSLLENLQFIKCKEKEMCNSNEILMQEIPIIIYLKNCSESVSIKSLIAKTLKSDISSVENLLKNKVVQLYLDGYDELSRDVRRTVNNDIDEIRSNKSIQIIITDRDNATAYKSYADKHFIISELDENERNTYFKNKLGEGSEAYIRVQNALQDELKWIESTPLSALQLEAIITIAESTKTFPNEREGLMIKYLETSLNREKVKGKQPAEKLINIETWLERIAEEIENKRMFAENDESKWVLNKREFKKTYGTMETATERKEYEECKNWVLDFPIIQKTEEGYRFVFPEYIDFFVDR